MTALLKLLRNTRGATMVEYAIMLAMIAVICIGTISALGSSVNRSFNTVASCMHSGNGGGEEGESDCGGGKP